MTDLDPTLESPQSDSAAVEFPCPNCGAKTRWDPETDALSCEHCNTVTQVPRDEGTILERPLSEAGEAARGLGLEVRVSQCGNCGARVTYDETATSEVCVYCGSANVLAQEANRNAIRPESLVPLDISRKNVEERFKKWLHGLWFRPNALKKQKKFEAVGVYVPFWTFDCAVHSDWSADAGHYYYVPVVYTVVVNGKPQVRTRMERRIRWVPAWGQRDDAYDDVLVHASKGMPEKLVQELGGFDTRELVPYRPEYLAGWRAEEYSVDLEQGWDAGQGAVEKEQRNRCAGDVPGDTYRNLRVKNLISGVHWKHILLPMWSLQYKFKGKVYTVLINGQTGNVEGEAPISWVKVLLAVVFALVAVGVALFVMGG